MASISPSPSSRLQCSVVGSGRKAKQNETTKANKTLLSVCAGKKDDNTCMSFSRQKSRHRQLNDEACCQILQLSFKEEATGRELLSKINSHIIFLKSILLLRESKGTLIACDSKIAARSSKIAAKARKRDCNSNFFDYNFVKSLPYIMDSDSNDSDIKVTGKKVIVNTEDHSMYTRQASSVSNSQTDILNDISNVHPVEIPQSGTAPLSTAISPKPKKSPLKASDQVVNSETSLLPSSPEQAKHPEVTDLKMENFIKNNANSHKPIQLVVICQPKSPEGEQKYLISASPAINTQCIDTKSHLDDISSTVQKASPNISSNNEQVGDYYLTTHKTPPCLIVEKSHTTEPLTKESTSEPEEKQLKIEPEKLYEPVNAMRKIFKSNRKVVKYNTSNVLSYTPSQSTNNLPLCSRKRKLSPEKVSYTHTHELKIVTETPPDDAILDKDIIFQEDKVYKEKLDKILSSVDKELWQLGEMDNLLYTYELNNSELNSSTPLLVELLGHDLTPEQDEQQGFSDLFENNENLKDLFLNPDSINNLKELSKLE